MIVTTKSTTKSLLIRDCQFWILAWNFCYHPALMICYIRTTQSKYSYRQTDRSLSENIRPFSKNNNSNQRCVIYHTSLFKLEDKDLPKQDGQTIELGLSHRVISIQGRCIQIILMPKFDGTDKDINRTLH